jgi:ferritin-like metal-binding protein YciE
MHVSTARGLFIHSLSDIVNAEQQLAGALSELVRAASNQALAKAFESHLDETHRQLQRIDQVVDLCGVRLQRNESLAMRKLLEEARGMIDQVEPGPLLDVALAGTAQKVGHYEIATYGTLASLASHLGFKRAAKLLHETVGEEKAMDERLSTFVHRTVAGRAKHG